MILFSLVKLKDNMAKKIIKEPIVEPFVVEPIKPIKIKKIKKLAVEVPAIEIIETVVIKEVEISAKTGKAKRIMSEAQKEALRLGREKALEAKNAKK